MSRSRVTHRRELTTRGIVHYTFPIVLVRASVSLSTANAAALGQACCWWRLPEVALAG